MSYLEIIRSIIEKIPATLIDFSVPRVRTRIPSQAASNFITNKEQGDWAERIIFEAVNETSTEYIAVKYGKSDDIIAGEEGFVEFFESFQDELDTIGKRPDILIYHKDDFKEEFGNDISQLDQTIVHDYVRKAVAGIEIRSSAFLIDKYDAYMQRKVARYTSEALLTKEKILSDYHELLDLPNRRKYIQFLENITPESLSVVSFTVPNWGSTPELIELNRLFKSLRDAIKEIKKRSYLSITPKVEDLRVVNKWIETFQVPHYYFQVFFDKVFAISYKDILTLLTEPDYEGVKFFIEGDVSNQNKKTIQRHARSTHTIANKVDEPMHKSVRKDMARGQLLFYVTFEKGYAYLDVNALKTVLELSEW